SETSCRRATRSKSVAGPSVRTPADRRRPIALTTSGFIGPCDAASHPATSARSMCASLASRRPDAAGSLRHHTIVERPHPRGAAAVVLEEVLPRRVLEGLGEPGRIRARQLERIAGPRPEEPEPERDATQETVLLGERGTVGGGEQPGRRDLADGMERVGAAEPRMPGSVAHLHGLGDE